MTKAEKAAAKAAKVAADKAAKEEAAKVKAAPKVSAEDAKKAAVLAKISDLKGQDAAGHKVTPAQLDELAVLAG